MTGFGYNLYRVSWIESREWQDFNGFPRIEDVVRYKFFNTKEEAEAYDIEANLNPNCKYLSGTREVCLSYRE